MTEETETPYTALLEKLSTLSEVVQGLQSDQELAAAAPKFSAPLFYEADGLAIYGEPAQCAEMFGDLAKAKAIFKAIPKNRHVEVKNREGKFLYSYDYAEMGPINEATEPALTANGFTPMQPVTRTRADSVTVHTMVFHSSGAFLVSEWKLNYSGEMKDMAGDLTLVQRYSYSKMFNLATDPDADSMPEDAKPQRGTKPDKPSRARSTAPRAGKKAKEAPPEDAPPPTDEDAPPDVVQQPAPVDASEPAKRPGARAKGNGAETPEEPAEPLRTSAQMEVIKGLQGELSLTPNQVRGLVISECGFDPKPNSADFAPFTAVAADVVIGRLQEMVQEQANG